jgi:hypothetical protein
VQQLAAPAPLGRLFWVPAGGTVVILTTPEEADLWMSAAPLEALTLAAPRRVTGNRGSREKQDAVAG